MTADKEVALADMLANIQQRNRSFVSVGAFDVGAVLAKAFQLCFGLL